MHRALPTGTVTFLYTDIEGSAALWERDAEAMHDALDLHNRVLHDAMAANNGCVYKIIGDAFQVAFEDPLPALCAAIDAQRGLAAADWGRLGPLKVRMGLHRGRAVALKTDYDTTHTLNRVARVMSAGHECQVLLSREVAEEIAHLLPENVTLHDLGRHRMKGLTQLEHLFQLVVPDLPDAFPPLKTLDITPNNLPHQLTSFIGRERELHQTHDLLATSRLVTLVGTGGCGKTRLALEAGAALQDRFPHGVWLVELAPLTDPAHIVETIANTVPLPEQRRLDPYEAILDFLREREVLLLLDNCEHLIDACARLAESLLHACPKLCILASSREALGVAGEVPLAVLSLATADPDDLPSLGVLRQVDAIQLYVERAALLRPDFALDEDNSAIVARICRRLDGIPLAIELAAARIRVLTVAQILERLEDRFRLLTGGSRTALPRQQTLRATIDWSYRLLTDKEQLLLRRLSVFNGGWTLEAAEAVGAGDWIETFEVLDLLSHLVDKSLILTEEIDGQIRYRRLESIRLYARERFQESDEVATIRDRHLAWCVAWAEEIQPKFSGKEWRARRVEGARELENARSAMAWSSDTGNAESAMRIAVSLLKIWDTGRQEEGRRWLQQGLKQQEKLPKTLLSDVLKGLGWMVGRLHDYESSLDYFERALSAARSIDDQYRIGWNLRNLAMVHNWLGEFDTNLRYLEEARAIFASIDDKMGLCQVLEGIAFVHLVRREGELALPYIEEALNIATELGREPTIGYFQNALGLIHNQLGRYDEAEILLKSGLRRGGYIIHSIFGLAVAAFREGDNVRAARLVGVYDTLQQSPAEHAIPKGETAPMKLISETIAEIFDRGDAAVLAAARAEGRNLSLDRAIAYALEEIEI